MALYQDARRAPLKDGTYCQSCGRPAEGSLEVVKVQGRGPLKLCPSCAPRGQEGPAWIQRK